MTASFAILRVLALVAIGAAVVGQLMHSIAFWQSQGVQNLAFQVLNFFSFFTIESNVLSVFVLTIAVFFWRAKNHPQWLNLLRAIATTFMATTGIVYALLLRGVELPQGATLVWSNEILHVVGPLWMIADWLFGPGRSRLEWKHIGTIVAFPVGWAAYTLIRGPFAIDERFDAPWYPYPFLNPDLSPNGYLSVSFYVILIAAVIGLMGAAVIRVSRSRFGLPGQDAPAVTASV